MADEDAFKVAALYTFATKTTVGGIFEMMHRYVNPALDFQNERQRNGTWLFFTESDPGSRASAAVGLMRSRRRGDPGQHNTPFGTTPIPGTTSADELFVMNNNNGPTCSRPTISTSSERT